VTRQVALLRGINVGGRNKIAMAPLREAISDLGYADVQTHLQSGNVVFGTATRPDRVASAVEAVIADRFGLAIGVVVRTHEELLEVVSGNPLPEAAAEPAQFLVNFLSAAPDPAAVAAIEPAEYEPDVFRVRGRDVYLYCPQGIRNSKLAVFPWGKRLGLVATARNWNTVTRLLEMTGS
jgi:uncharacterized protein (DUF1697 family)